MDTLPPVLLPDEMIMEILSYFDVKTLMQLTSVSKTWKILISNPAFVNLHLQKSSLNPHLTLLWSEICLRTRLRTLSPFPLPRLLHNLSIIDASYNGFHACSYGLKLRDYTRIVGSCNGLVCFYGRTLIDRHPQYWIEFQNPAMRTRSDKFGHFIHFDHSDFGFFKFSFGYDFSAGTYKVVAFSVDRQLRTQVKVFNLRDNCWRQIQTFPVPPLGCLQTRSADSKPNDGVHFIGTINWLALSSSNTFTSQYDSKYIHHVEDFVILSLSLSTETYTQFLLPQGFHEVPRLQPTLGVLSNSLCFSHDFRGSHFVIWQMSEFGVPESWTQVIKFSYQTLHMDIAYKWPFLPLYLSDNNDTLIFAYYEEEHRNGVLVDGHKWAIIYSSKDERVEKTRVSRQIDWFSTMSYVESLVQIT